MIGGPGVNDAHRTDLGNAKRLIAKFGRVIRYCHPWKCWLIWSGKFWRRDEDGRIYSLAKDVVVAIYAKALDMIDDADRKALISHALVSEGEVRLRAMVTLASTEPGVPVQPEDLDTDHWLFNCQNGTLDLRTGELRPHEPGDLITKISPAEFDPEMESDLWSSCLHRWANGDRSLVGFLRRIAGYALTGDVGEECLFVLYGSGRNGKVKFIGALQCPIHNCERLFTRLNPKNYEVNRQCVKSSEGMIKWDEAIIQPRRYLNPLLPSTAPRPPPGG